MNGDQISEVDLQLGELMLPDKSYSPTEEEIKKTQNLIQELKKKSYIELLNELYNLLQIDDPIAFHGKMKGFIGPFNSQTLNLKIPESSPPRRIMKLDPQTADTIKRILKERKDQKLKEIEEKENLDKLNLLENKKKSKIINDKIKSNFNSDKNQTKENNKYSNIKKNKIIYKKKIKQN